MSHEPIWPPEVRLEGQHVALELSGLSHAADLAAAIRDGGLHELWYTTVPAPERIEAEIQRRLGLRARGSMLPFSVLLHETGRAVGMTSFMNIAAEHRRVEIGSTWYCASVQRSPVNTECKLLMLRHAFENLDCIAVEFCTHVLNTQSRKAIERLGAKLDGIRRAHQILANGTIRDTAVYSITAAEWPMVKANLEWQMRKPRRAYR